MDDIIFPSVLNSISNLYILFKVLEDYFFVSHSLRALISLDISSIQRRDSTCNKWTKLLCQNHSPWPHNEFDD